VLRLSQLDDENFYPLLPKASALVRKFGSKVIAAAGDKPILDVACGSGRNAIFFSQRGCSVICADKDLTFLQNWEASWRRTSPAQGDGLALRWLDFKQDVWPFETGGVGGIINVHFFLPPLFPHFEDSLSPGGYLIFESVPGCGGNYMELPAAGYVRSLLARSFEIEHYKERKVGPPGANAVVTQVLARRRSE
jgi:SAM-dependent methyltransferase